MLYNVFHLQETDKSRRESEDREVHHVGSIASCWSPLENYVTIRLDGLLETNSTGCDQF